MDKTNSRRCWRWAAAITCMKKKKKKRHATSEKSLIRRHYVTCEKNIYDKCGNATCEKSTYTVSEDVAWQDMTCYHVTRFGDRRPTMTPLARRSGPSQKSAQGLITPNSLETDESNLVQFLTWVSGNESRTRQTKKSQCGVLYLKWKAWVVSDNNVSIVITNAMNMCI